MIVGVPNTSNIMQRVFDVLLHRGPMSMEQIEDLLPWDRLTIQRAFRRLRQFRCLSTECRDKVWFYSIRKGAVRPMGKRAA